MDSLNILRQCKSKSLTNIKVVMCSNSTVKYIKLKRMKSGSKYTKCFNFF